MGAVDAERVVARIADFGIGLALRLHVRADAAEPDQVHGSLQDGIDETRRVAGLGIEAERLADLRRQRDRFLGTRENAARSEEHTSELQSLMRISYDVFCLKQKNAPQH